MKNQIPGIDVCKTCKRMMFSDEEATGKDGLLYHKDCLNPGAKSKKKKNPVERYGRMLLFKLEDMKKWSEENRDRATVRYGGAGGARDYSFAMKAANHGFGEIIKLVQITLSRSMKDKDSLTKFRKNVCKELLLYEFEEWTTEYCDSILKRKLNIVKKKLAEIVKTNSEAQLEKLDFNEIRNMI